jgi:hypothetical protein
MNDLIKKLNIDETYTKPLKKIKKFNKVKDNIPLKADYNFMADLLMLPTTKKGNKYILSVVDLATDEFDIEPIKDKEPETTLKALKSMFKRPYINEPYASIRTDGGTEFKGIFHKYLYEKSILHKISIPDRHKQLGNVEYLNRQLGRLLNGYMNSKEEELGEVYKEWDDTKILNIIRKDLNDIRKKPEKDIYTHIYNMPEYVKPKFKIGDIVFRRLEAPYNALGNKQSTKNFREGDYRYDRVPRKIVNVLNYPAPVNNRYMLDTLKNVSYIEDELIFAPKTEKQEKFTVKEILSKKKIKNKVHYLVWWKGYKKTESTWEPVDELKKDVPKLIEEYEKNN